MVSKELIASGLTTVQMVFLMIGAVLGGYTVKDMPEYLQEFLLHPAGRFVLYLIIAASISGFSYEKRNWHIAKILTSATAFTLFVTLVEAYIKSKKQQAVAVTY